MVILLPWPERAQGAYPRRECVFWERVDGLQNPVANRGRGGNREPIDGLESRAWLSVGGATTVAVSLNETSPAFAPLGRARTNSFAACFAASRRVGSTSRSCMLALTSMLIISAGPQRDPKVQR